MSLVTPDYAGGSIVNLAASVLQAFGIAPPNPPCRAALLDPELLADAPGVVLLICDALGLHQCEAGLESGRAPSLERLIRQSAGGLRSLTSVFPSTTTTALPSLSTALTPAQHGMLGHRQWLVELGALANMLRFSTVAEKPVPIDADLLRRGPTLFERLAERAIPAVAISAKYHEGTGFTDLLHRGAVYLGYEAQSEISYLLRHSIHKHRGQRSFHYVYWPMIDTLSHLYGPLAEPCLLELEFADLMLGKIIDCCAETGHVLILTADHGQIALDPRRAVLLDGSFGGLLNYPPGGGRRACYLSAPDPEALRQHSSLQADGLLLLSPDEAIARGWFGGDCGPFRARLGDLIALSIGDRQLLYDYGQGAAPNQGGHAGLDEEEMRVPLVVAPHH